MRIGPLGLIHSRDMRAIVIAKPGGPEVLELREVPTPAPSRGEVRVRIRATAVNRADLLQRLGVYPAPPGAPPDIPGLEIAGEVDAIGDEVTELAVGDRVFGLVGGGGYAEQVTAHARTLARMPEGMSFTDAAAVPEAFVTAWDAMVDQASLSPGETVLVNAVGSGVGTAAVQIARAIGARTLGTARTADKLERARPLGLDEGILTLDGKFSDEACLAHKGRIVVVGAMAGATVDLNLAILMHKRGEIRGTMLRSRPLEEKILAARAFERHVVPLFARGALRPIVDRVLPLARAGEAHTVMQSNETFGKVVLEVG
jgi:NADPH2:quinone reductase